MKQRRNTAATTEILHVLDQSATALSHADIQQAMGEVCDRVTIYRVLDRLAEDGLVHKIVNVDGVMNYAACHTCSASKHHHNHIHFSCQKCKSVTCLENIEPSFTMPQGYQVSQVNFTVSGLCPKCLH